MWVHFLLKPFINKKTIMARQLNAPNKVQNKVIMEQALGVIPALFDDFRRIYPTHSSTTYRRYYQQSKGREIMDLAVEPIINVTFLAALEKYCMEGDSTDILNCNVANVLQLAMLVKRSVVFDFTNYEGGGYDEFEYA